MMWKQPQATRQHVNKGAWLCSSMTLFTVWARFWPTGRHLPTTDLIPIVTWKRQKQVLNGHLYFVELMWSHLIGSVYYVPINVFQVPPPSQETTRAMSGRQNHAKPAKTKEVFASRHQQENSNFSKHLRIQTKERHQQKIHKIYKYHKKYGKHPTSLTIRETYVMYYFPFIILANFSKENSKYLHRGCKTGIFIHYWSEYNLSCLSSLKMFIQEPFSYK